MYFAWLNPIKLGVTLGASSLAELQTFCWLHARWTGKPIYADLRAANPGLLICALSPLSEHGPYPDFVAIMGHRRAAADRISETVPGKQKSWDALWLPHTATPRT